MENFWSEISDLVKDTFEKAEIAFNKMVAVHEEILK